MGKEAKWKYLGVHFFCVDKYTNCDLPLIIPLFAAIFLTLLFCQLISLENNSRHGSCSKKASVDMIIIIDLQGLFCCTVDNQCSAK